MAVNTEKMNEFLGRFVNDLCATVHAGMVVIGERLGLYHALATGPMTAAQLAAQTRTNERYLREWLASQAAGGYLTYYSETQKFGMTEEQVLTLAMHDGPAYLPGAFELALGSLAAVPALPNFSARVPAWPGPNMTIACFMDARSSFVRATPRI